MEQKIFFGVILFTFALIIYSIATWAGVFSGKLKKWHLFLFWTGFIADVSGTLIIGSVYSGFVMNKHSILGTIALIAILVQNITATKILKDGNKKWIINLPKILFLPVWVLWMISYISGLLSGGSR